VRDNASLIQFVRPWVSGDEFGANWGRLGEDIKLASPPLLAAGAIALLTISVNFVVDWFLHKTSGLKE